MYYYFFPLVVFGFLASKTEIFRARQPASIGSLEFDEATRAPERKIIAVLDIRIVLLKTPPLSTLSCPGRSAVEVASPRRRYREEGFSP